MRWITSLLLVFSIVGCEEDIVDNDNDSYGEEEDCNDKDAKTFPGAPEACDGLDNDCDGDIDEHITEDYYLDDDGDGYGAGEVITSCAPLEGYVLIDGDCDDTRAEMNPGLTTDPCDALDNDCDGYRDEDATYEARYLDDDGDGFGDPAVLREVCNLEDPRFVTNGNDCDDTNEAINPSADELCDEIDNNCNTTIDEDPTNGVVFYRDGDNDGFGRPDFTEIACTELVGFVSDNTDCDDSNPNSWPNAPERCDEEDNDCDTEVDEWEDLIDDYCFKGWDGQDQFRVEDAEGNLWCDSYFDSTGTPTSFSTASCPDCEFAFRVTHTFDEDESLVDRAVCSEAAWLGRTFAADYTHTLAFTEDYFGEGSMLLLSYGATWYPLLSAELDTTTGEMTYASQELNTLAYDEELMLYTYIYAQEYGTATLTP